MKIIWLSLLLSLQIIITSSQNNDVFYYGCIFSGTKYSEGSILDTTCFIMLCQSNQWRFLGINYQCGECYVHDDPHFKTFDNRYYDWHGTFNYTLSQPFSCNGSCNYAPEYGIYGDFKECYYNPAVSCIDVTTYKMNPYTAVTIRHSNVPRSLLINGNLINIGSTPLVPAVARDCLGNLYPLIVFSDTVYCIYIVGKEFSVIACTSAVFIYAHKSKISKLGGLCGNYNNDPNDDYITRDKCLTTNSEAVFAASWSTLEQSQTCNINTGFGKRQANMEVVGNCNTNLYYNACKDAVLEGNKKCKAPMNATTCNNTIDNCVEDCCSDPNNKDRWIVNAKLVASQICENNNNKVDESGNTLPPQFVTDGTTSSAVSSDTTGSTSSTDSTGSPDTTGSTDSTSSTGSSDTTSSTDTTGPTSTGSSDTTGSTGTTGSTSTGSSDTTGPTSIGSSDTTGPTSTGSTDTTGPTSTGSSDTTGSTDTGTTGKTTSFGNHG